MALLKWMFQPTIITMGIVLWIFSGEYNCIYSLAPQQPEKDLPRQHLAAKVWSLTANFYTLSIFSSLTNYKTTLNSKISKLKQRKNLYKHITFHKFTQIGPLCGKGGGVQNNFKNSVQHLKVCMTRLFIKFHSFISFTTKCYHSC